MKIDRVRRYNSDLKVTNFNSVKMSYSKDCIDNTNTIPEVIAPLSDSISEEFVVNIESVFKKQFKPSYTSSTSNSASKLSQVDVISFSDIHGHIRGLGTIISMVENMNANSTLITFDGDMFSGEFPSSALGDRPVIKAMATFMRKGRLDALTLGNNDIKNLNKFKELIREAGITPENSMITVANADISDRELKPLVKPYRIVEKGGHYFVIVGLTTPNLDKNGIRSYDEKRSIESAKEALMSASAQLKTQGVNSKDISYIILSHGGGSFDRKLAEELHLDARLKEANIKVNLILSSHDHVRDHKRVGLTSIVQSPAGGHHVSVSTIYFSKQGPYTITANVIRVPRTVKLSSKFEAILNEVEKTLNLDTLRAKRITLPIEGEEQLFQGRGIHLKARQLENVIREGRIVQLLASRITAEIFRRRAEQVADELGTDEPVVGLSNIGNTFNPMGDSSVLSFLNATSKKPVDKIITMRITYSDLLRILDRSAEYIERGLEGIKRKERGDLSAIPEAEKINEALQWSGLKVEYYASSDGKTYGIKNGYRVKRVWIREGNRYVVYTTEELEKMREKKLILTTSSYIADILLPQLGQYEKEVLAVDEVESLRKDIEKVQERYNLNNIREKYLLLLALADRYNMVI